MELYSSNHHPTHMFKSLWLHRELFLQLVKRDILTKYRGSFGGLLWLVISPLLMLSLYTMVFGYFMQVRWPGVESNMMYSLIIYVGLTILNFFSECLNRSPSIIVNNPNYVKKVVFPLEIFPWVIIGGALFHAVINVLMLTVFCFFILGKINLTILFLPLLFIPLILITAGLSWFLSSLGVFLRDLTHMMVFIMQIIMYLSPVFYSTKNFDPAIQTFFLINPLTFVIEQARSIVIFGIMPDWSGLAIYSFISIFFASLGFYWFQKIRNGFADVL